MVEVQDWSDMPSCGSGSSLTACILYPVTPLGNSPDLAGRGEHLYQANETTCNNYALNYVLFVVVVTITDNFNADKVLYYN